jgi:hypothetical protein
MLYHNMEEKSMMAVSRAAGRRYLHPNDTGN